MGGRIGGGEATGIGVRAIISSACEGAGVMGDNVSATVTGGMLPLPLPSASARTSVLGANVSSFTVASGFSVVGVVVTNGAETGRVVLDEELVGSWLVVLLVGDGEISMSSS